MNNFRSIQPIRILPFDLGVEIDSKLSLLLENFLRSNGYSFMEEGIDALKSISSAFLFSIVLNEAVSIYIFDYGIGLALIEDDEFLINGEDFSPFYCQERKNQHASILKTHNHKYSNIIDSTVLAIRNFVRLNATNEPLRFSSESCWENKGYSYVFTLSIVKATTTDVKLEYSLMSDVDKRNLSVLLDPGIANKEDTFLDKDFEQRDFCSFNLPTEIPKNFVNSTDRAVYISWASVIIFVNNKEEEKNNNIISNLINLEIDIQAMWMYTYCLFSDLRNHIDNNKKPYTVFELKHKYYYFTRKYSEFLQASNASLTSGIKEIRKELIETSSIDGYRARLEDYTKGLIDEREALNEEKHAKLSKALEIMLFAIGSFDIVPVIYNLFVGKYNNLDIKALIPALLFLLAGCVLIFFRDFGDR